MSLVYRFIFCALFVSTQAENASRSPGFGYLFINGSLPPFCYDMKPNDVCPPNLVNYKIVGFNRSTEAAAKLELTSVHLGLEALNFFQVSESCRDSYREYLCSDTFAVCTPDSKHGVILKYDYERSKAACDSVRSNCPGAVTSYFVQNCTMIHKDASGYGYCTKLPEVQGDICPKTSYTYPAAIGPLYKLSAKRFPEVLKSLEQAKLFANSTCEEEFVNVYCQLIRSSLCSTDMTLRMFAISQQECSATFTKCLTNTVPKLKNYFLDTCNIFPDGNTAERVPLPSAGTNWIGY
ncbi:uncharacterized protein LOC114526450 [Dendronephthya gigantea]|uniref:uncharacterized protein LOC114526450 n=1 Tax=Dendronephthya gigantea TaxID=151771 RepID=UPI001069477D|nr:uncharacterized protein LOC114526450 [Dendronephthya gigantea]